MSAPMGPWGRAYRELWCPPHLYEGDPEGCSAGLAIGYIWFPLLILLIVTVFVYLLVRACRSHGEEEEEAPYDVHR